MTFRLSLRLLAIFLGNILKHEYDYLYILHTNVQGFNLNYRPCEFRLLLRSHEHFDTCLCRAGTHGPPCTHSCAYFGVLHLLLFVDLQPSEEIQ